MRTKSKSKFLNKKVFIHIIAGLFLLASIVSFVLYFADQTQVPTTEVTPYDTEYLDLENGDLESTIAKISAEIEQSGTESLLDNGDTAVEVEEFLPDDAVLDEECDFEVSDCVDDVVVINRKILLGCIFLVIAVGVEVFYFVSSYNKKSTRRARKSTKVVVIGLLLLSSMIGTASLIIGGAPTFAADDKWELVECKVISIDKETGEDQKVDCNKKGGDCIYNGMADITAYCSLKYSKGSSLHGLYINAGSSYRQTLRSNFFSTKGSKKNTVTRLEVIYEIYDIAKKSGLGVESVKYANPVGDLSAALALERNRVQNPKEKYATSIHGDATPLDIKAAARWAVSSQIYLGCKYYEDYKSAGQIWDIIRTELYSGGRYNTDSSPYYRKYIHAKGETVVKAGSYDYIRFCWNTKATHAWTMGVIKNYLVNYVNRKEPLTKADVTGETAVCGYGAKLEADGNVSKTDLVEAVPESLKTVLPIEQLTKVRSPIIMVLTANVIFKKTLEVKKANTSVNTRYSAACVYRPNTEDSKILDTTKDAPGLYLKKTKLTSALKKLKATTEDLIKMRKLENAKEPPPDSTDQTTTENSAPPTESAEN
jgi:hypothetical protein